MKKQDKRQKISLVQIMNIFPDDETAEQWFINNRWTNGISCPYCNSHNVTERKTAKRSWRCKDCRKDFSTKTATLMQGSNLGFRTWAIAIYLLTTNLKGIASTKLASNLDVTQKTAWHLTMRIRETYNDNKKKLSSIVEVDKTYVEGKEANKHQHKKLNARHGTVSKKAVTGAKERSGKIVAQPVNKINKDTLHGFIKPHVKERSHVMTDEHRSYIE